MAQGIGRDRQREYNGRYRLPTQSGNCENFFDFISQQISRNRTLLSSSRKTQNGDCIFSFTMKCFTTGNSSPNKLRKVIECQFPNAELQEFSRRRS